VLFHGLRGLCVGHVDEFDRFRGEAPGRIRVDFWSGLDQVDFWRFEIPLFIENCMMLINLSK
jgi:hypothetical protein